MPVLRQRQDGGYYIRGRIPGMGSFCTWQVTPDGVALLQQSGITDGDEFSGPLLRELCNLRLVYTNRGGVDVAIPPQTETPLPHSPDPLPLLFKEWEDAWQLQLVLPALPKSFLASFVSTDAVLDTLERCGFRVDQTHLVQAMRLWPGRGDAACDIEPHQDPYKVEPTGLWPDQWALTAWTRGADGLRGAGTLFAGPELGGLCLRRGEPIFPGGSCFLVARHDPGDLVAGAAVLRIPPDLRPRELPPREAWSAWELHIPTQVHQPVHEWFLGMGHPIGEPVWRLHLLSPPPSSYSPSGLPIVEAGCEVLIAVYPPPGADLAGARVELLAERDAAPVAHLPVQLVASTVQANATSESRDVGYAGSGDRDSRPVYIAWPVSDEGMYRVRAAAGRVAPLAFVAVPPPPSHELADLSRPGPLELVIAAGSTRVDLRAFVDGPGPHEVSLSSLDGGAVPGIEVRCLVPVDVSWSCGELRGQCQRVVPEDVQHLLAGDLSAGLAGGRLCMLRIDAGNFGMLRVHLIPPVLAPMDPNGPVPGETAGQTRRTTWRARWLAAAVPALMQRPHMPATALSICTRAALAKLARLHQTPELEHITAAPRPLASHLRALGKMVERHEPRTYAQVDPSAAGAGSHGCVPEDLDGSLSAAERGSIP